jgi:daunorubicin resistance ABC transporter ATP-binding subunit
MDAMVDVQDLRKVFSPDIKAVDGVSFRVERGEIFGFLGPNGAGKSTTIKILATLLASTSGTVRVDGLDPARQASDVRKIIGYTAQETSVDDQLTGRENLRLQCNLHHLRGAAAEARVNQLLEAVDLVEASDRKAGTYSGGMRKRLDLAGGLIGNPKLLFLDEPTTGLDPQNRQALWKYIQSLNDAGTTIFLTTQYMEEADRLADRLCIIDHGKIVAEGTPKALKAEIGADVVQIFLEPNGGGVPKDKARAALAPLKGIQQVNEFDDGVAVYAKDAPALIASIVRALDDAKVPIAQLTLSRPSLDDVFVKYTGHKMRVEEVKPRSRMGMGPRRRPM